MSFVFVLYCDDNIERGNIPYSFPPKLDGDNIIVVVVYDDDDCHTFGKMIIVYDDYDDDYTWQGDLALS